MFYTWGTYHLSINLTFDISESDNLILKCQRSDLYLSLMLKIFDLRSISNNREFGFHASILTVNPFPHIDAFLRLCSRRIFENIETKEEIAQNKLFLLLPQCFPLLVIGYPCNYRDFLLFDKKVVCCRIVVWGKGLSMHCLLLYNI